MSDYEPVTETARSYYNSDDADNFYFTLWGGEDLHIGIYNSDDESIFDASRRTVETMAGMLSSLGKDSNVMDLGAGYGGVARYLVETHGCKVECLNLSEVQNERNRHMNRERGLDSRIGVIDGSFEDVPAADETFDIVWCEDSILHSAYKDTVIKEVARILKPGGDFIFTDPMQSDDADPAQLQPVYDRIHLDSMGSISLYRKLCADNGLEEVEIRDFTPHLPRHYGRVRKELQTRYDELSATISTEYIDRMIQGLTHWVEAGSKGNLAWAIMHFRKKK